MSSKIQLQVPIPSTPRVNGEFSIRHHILLEELQHPSFLPSWKTSVVFDAVLVHHDSDVISWTHHPPDDIADQRNDTESDEEAKHRTRHVQREARPLPPAPKENGLNND